MYSPFLHTIPHKILTVQLVEHTKNKTQIDSQNQTYYLKFFQKLPIPISNAFATPRRILFGSLDSVIEENDTSSIQQSIDKHLAQAHTNYMTSLRSQINGVDRTVKDQKQKTTNKQNTRHSTSSADIARMTKHNTNKEHNVLNSSLNFKPPDFEITCKNP